MTGAAGAAPGAALVHEAAIYGSDAELCETAVPFVTAGLDAQEPTYVILGPHAQDLVGQVLGERPGLHYLPAAENYVNPAVTVQSYRAVLTAEVEAGARQIRFITEVPHPGIGSAWDWWGRYESACNQVFADLPVWALCTYDARSTPQAVLDEVVRTHPYLSGRGDVHARNGDYEPPTTFLARRSCAYTDPLESGAPQVALADPSLAEARRAAAELARAQLGEDSADNLALAVSEVVTNAQLYGRPPVQLRLWSAPDRVVAAITDGGDGIHDATIGLAPVDSARSGGRGLWIANQLCNHLGISRSQDGFAIRLVVGTPSLAS